MGELVPKANASLSKLLGHAVEVEVAWGDILHAGLSMDGRITVSTTLTSGKSRMVLQLLIDSIQTVLQKADAMIPEHEAQDGHAPNILRTGVSRVRLGIAPGSAAKPVLHLEPVDKSVDSDGSGNVPTVLVYAPALERQARGCFTSQELRSELRKMGGIPVPKDEQGFSGVAGKAEATVTQLSRNVETGLRDVGKKMGALWSRFKR